MVACRGVHLAIIEADKRRLLEASDDHALLQVIQDDIEARWDENWLYQSDKAWDAIHRCLSNGTLDPGTGVYPLHLAVLNGRRLYAGDDYIVSLVAADQVQDIALTLAAVDLAWLKSRYDAIDPDAYGVPKSDEDWEYTRAYFEGLTPFFQNAAASGRSVISTVDQ